MLSWSGLTGATLALSEVWNRETHRKTITAVVINFLNIFQSNLNVIIIRIETTNLLANTVF